MYNVTTRKMGKKICLKNTDKKKMLLQINK